MCIRHRDCIPSRGRGLSVIGGFTVGQALSQSVSARDTIISGPVFLEYLSLFAYLPQEPFAKMGQFDQRYPWLESVESSAQ